MKKIIIAVLLCCVLSVPAMYLNLIERKFFDFVVTLSIFCVSSIGIIGGLGILKLNDLHKSILMMVLLPPAVYPSLRSSDWWWRTYTVLAVGAIFLTSSYYLHRFLKSRRHVP
ncbi:MAG: hypothetical protein FGF53_08700 [Candidatus Brockarchaeota archaeon]|nr:hypothetical protein [Candidatus Brockarchaeota archaeon]MBO3809503.1 hypothetical protein [Candidatus Brockarchaeota archaeon]